jgi:cytochrome c553
MRAALCITLLITLALVGLPVLGHEAMAERPGDPAEVYASGAELFEAVCSECHGSQGTGGYAPSLQGCVICSDKEALRDKINEDMPRDDPDWCRGECADMAAEYVHGLNQ